MPTRYTSRDDDNTRWDGFPFRDGDIVISTRSKSGTTWTQMICALLIFGTADLPAPLGQLSPWLDHLVRPRHEVFDRLAAQTHRRFIKTHTPLDGLPLDPRATYLVVARHPLDTAVSMYHHGQNLNRARIAHLSGNPTPAGLDRPRPPLTEWLLAWIDRDVSPQRELESLPGLLFHVTDAWRRRAAAGADTGPAPDIVLLHYQDLCDDLAGQMRALAGRLGIAVPEARWPQLVDAATFARMRARADVLVPDRNGILLDVGAFFRRGRSGAGRELLSDAQYRHYRQCVARLAPPEVDAWLHRADDGTGADGHAAPAAPAG